MSAAVPHASIFERLRPEAMREATDWDGAAVLPAGADAAVSVRGEGGSSSGHATTYLADNTEWSATGRMGVSISRYLPYISFTSPPYLPHISAATGRMGVSMGRATAKTRVSRLALALTLTLALTRSPSPGSPR